MQMYYDVCLRNENTNGSISYLADSFSVDEYRILRIKSREFGDVTVKIDVNERLTVSEFWIEDNLDFW